METMLIQGDAASFMAEIRQQDKTLWEKVRDWFKNLAEKLRGVVDAYQGYTPDSPEGRIVAQMEDFIGVLQEAYSEALMDASENYRANEGKKNTTREGGVKHSVRTTEDGTKYVVLDGNIFVDSNGKKLSPKQAYNALVGQEITLEDGDTITFVKKLPGRDMYNELFRKYPGYTDDFDIIAVNWNVNRNIIDVFTGSSIQERNQKPKHYHYNVQDFDQRQVFITDGNEVYRLELNIANLTDGKKVAYVKRFIERASAEISEKIKKAETARKHRLNQPSGISIRNGEPIVNPESAEKRSDRDPTAKATLKALDKQGKALEADVENLMEMLRLQGDVIRKDSSILSAARYLSTYHGVIGSKQDPALNKELAGLLKDFYVYLDTEKDLSWEQIAEKAKPVTEWIFKHTEAGRQRSEYARNIQ